MLKSDNNHNKMCRKKITLLCIFGYKVGWNDFSQLLIFFCKPPSQPEKIKNKINMPRLCLNLENLKQKSLPSAIRVPLASDITPRNLRMQPMQFVLEVQTWSMSQTSAGSHLERWQFWLFTEHQSQEESDCWTSHYGINLNVTTKKHSIVL